MAHSHARIVAVLSLAQLPALAQQVWVVGPAIAPGVDFYNFTQAVNAAASGDIILVKSAVAGSFFGDINVGSKALTIVADEGAPPTIGDYGRLKVSNLGPSETVTVRGCILPGFGLAPFSGIGGTVEFKDSPGSLLLEDCQVTGTLHGLHATNSGWVGISKSTLDGTSFSLGEIAGVGAGLASYGTVSTVHGSSLDGGAGQFMYVQGNPIGLQGGAGVLAYSSTVVVSGSTLQGGNGSGSQFSAYFSSCVYSSGGPGLWLGAGTPTVHVLDTSASPGGAGVLNPPCTSPASVPGVYAQSGSWTAPTGAAPLLDSSRVTREGGTLSATLTTTSGEFGLLLAASSVQPLYLSEFYGPLLNPAAGVLPLGIVGVSGSVGASATIQELGAGVEGAVVYLQGASVDFATLTVRMSNVSVAVLLDGGI